MKNQKKISEIFQFLNKQNIDFIILRKQEKLFDAEENDIDILTKYNHLDHLKKIFKKFNFLTYTDSKYTNNYLYKSIPHTHFYNKDKDLNFDICFDISYRSINNYEFIPINDEQLEFIWSNKIKIDREDFYHFQMDDYSQIIHLICHCVFDKNKFSDYYQNKISEIFNKIDRNVFLKMVDPIFYRFRNNLYELIQKKNFNHIFNEYLSFKDY